MIKKKKKKSREARGRKNERAGYGKDESVITKENLVILAVMLFSLNELTLSAEVKDKEAQAARMFKRVSW